jgi:hypothetical protein
VQKPEGKRSLGSPRYRCNDDTEVTVEELGWQNVDWIHLAQDRNHWWSFMNTVISLVVTSWATTSSSIRILLHAFS